MIHYYLHHMGVRDVSTHGSCFQNIMADINRKLGRHITVQATLTQEQCADAAERRHTVYIVAKVLLNDGRIAVKSLPRVREKIEHFKQEALHWDIVKHVELYATSNPYFSRYPRSSAMKLQLPVDPAEFEKALADALALNL